MASPISLGSASPAPSLLRRSPKTDEENAPLDSFNLVYLNIFYQGISSHFPWNVLIAGQSFFRAKLEGLEMARDFLSHFTIIFIIIKYIFLLSPLFLFRKYNPKWIVYISTIGNSAAFLALTIVSCTPMDQRSFYIGALICVLFGSVFSALWEAGILTIIGQFPVKYTQSYLAGGGVAGIIVIIINIAAYFIAGTSSSDTFAKVYFGISFALILAGYFFFWFAQDNNYYRHYNRIVEEVAAKREHEVEENLEKIRDCSTFTGVLGQVKDIAAAIFISSTVGFIIFPEFMFNTKSVMIGTAKETWFHRDMFINLALFLANVAELFGKLLPLIPVFSFQRGPYVLFALARSVFIPLLFFGNVKITGYQLPFKPYLASDIAFYILISLSVLTSSYLYTVSMMWAPNRVKKHERTLAVAIIIISGGLGFALGTCISMLAKHLILRHSTPI